MGFRGAQKMKTVGQCRARCEHCQLVLPHHVVKVIRSYRLARFALFSGQTRHALLCARCHTRSAFSRPGRSLALLIPVVLLLAAL